MNDPATAMTHWAQLFNAPDPDGLAGLYRPDATLWGTLGRTLTASPAAIRAYFHAAAQAGLRVVPGERTLSPLAADVVLDAGAYTFSRPTGDGQTAAIPARYSLLLVNGTEGWRIAHQHSSVLPQPL